MRNHQFLPKIINSFLEVNGSRPTTIGGNNQEEKVKEKEGKRDGKNIRKPIIRFGPLRGSNLVTLNKEKGKDYWKRTHNLGMPCYISYVQVMDEKMGKEVKKELIEEEEKREELSAKQKATNLMSNKDKLNESATVDKEALGEVQSDLPASEDTGKDKNTDGRADKEALGEVPSDLPASEDARPGLADLKPLSKSLDKVEEEDGNYVTVSSDSEEESAKETDSDSDEIKEIKVVKKRDPRSGRSRAKRPTRSLTTTRGKPGMTSTPETKPATKRTRFEAGFTPENNEGKVKQRTEKGSEKGKEKDRAKKDSEKSKKSSGRDNDRKRKDSEKSKKDSGKEEKKKDDEPPKKKQKKSFAEVLKEKRLVVEIRASDPDIQLDQKDFEHIDDETFFTLPTVRPVKANMTEEDADWVVEYKGVAHGACWYTCKNEKTVENWIKLMKIVQPPEGSNYTYLVYGPGQRPYRYFTLRIPRRFVTRSNNDLDKLMECVRGVNYFLTATYTNKDGQERRCHAKFLKVLENKDSTKPKDDPKYCILKVEVEELLFQPILKEKGMIHVGMTPYELRGGGLHAALKMMQEKGVAAAVEHGLQAAPEDVEMNVNNDDA